MEPSVLYTIIGLLIAVYAIVPPERKIDLKVRFNWLDLFLLALAFFLVHYIMFYPVLESLGLAYTLGNWKWGFTPSNASYLIILSTTFFLFIRYHWAPLRKGKINLFQKLNESLLQEKKYSELLFILENNYERLFRIYYADFFLPNLKRKLTMEPILRIDFSKLGLPNNDEPDIDQNNSTFKTLKYKLKDYLQDYLIYIPAGDEASRVAEKIISRVLLSDGFNAYLAKANPDLGFKILEYKFRERKRFLSIFVKNMLADQSSILYFEIYYNQETTGLHRYKIDKRNIFLSYFLQDAKKAHELSVYKPFGDYFLQKLDELYLKSDDDPYNDPLLNYFEEDRWECPLHTTIRFFDIMVIEALYQNVNWHMWLYYFPSFVRKIIRNLDPNSNVDFNKEWPTPYHYLIYEILSVLKKFVRPVEEIPNDQANISLDNERVDHENDNIPKSAILAIGQIVRQVILTDKLDLDFKSYLLKTVLRLLSDLNRPDIEEYRRVLHQSVLAGGLGFNNNNQHYQERLNVVLQNVDDIILIGELEINA